MKIVILEKLVGESGSPGRVSRPRKNTAKPWTPPPAQPKKKKRAGTGGGGGSRGRVAGVSSKASEVLVKVSGFSKGGAHAKSNLTYIARHGEIDLENERGEVIRGKEELKTLATDWNADIEDRGRGKNQRDTMHLILSMPGTDNPIAMHNATRRFAAETFGNHEYVFALHNDTDNHHCHLTVKCRGFDGKQLHVAKGDPQAWRETFAEYLRAEGVAAEATPRVARGVTRKAEKQVLRHIDDPAPPDRDPRISRVRRSQFNEAAAELIAERWGAKSPERPWEAGNQNRHAQAQAAWKNAAERLEAASQGYDQPAARTYSNERPVYRRIDRRAARFGQLHAARRPKPDPERNAGRASGRGRGGGGDQADPAALRQPGFDGAGRRTTTKPHASVRDMPSSDVVSQHGGTEMLLLPDARHDVGTRRGAGAHHAVRRPRAGLDPTGRGHGGQMTDAELAAQMRDFAASMPPPVSQVEQIKAQLRERQRRAGQQQPEQVQPVRPGQPQQPPPERGPER